MYRLKDKFDNIGNNKWIVIAVIAFVAGILVKSNFGNGMTVIFGFISEALGLYMLAIFAYGVMDLLGKNTNRAFYILGLVLKPYLKHFEMLGALCGPIVAFIVLAVLQKVCESFAF